MTVRLGPRAVAIMLVLAVVGPFAVHVAPARAALPDVVVAYNRNGDAVPIPGMGSDVAGTAVASGWDHFVAALPDGTVTAWRTTSVSVPTCPDSELDVPAGLDDVVAVSAGFCFSLALKADGTVVGWGADDEGQSDVPAGLASVRAISAGVDNGLALRSDGTV